MGIVVTIFMFLGLLTVSPIKYINLNLLKAKAGVFEFIGFGLLFLGLWNFFWFGLRHLTLFWGWAALVSGLFMIIVALFVLAKSRRPLKVVANLAQYLQPFYCLALFGLLFCFLLYAVTLIQLNLGYGIIG